MSIPVCELCHATSFVKEDGMFVCQNCGTKYSPEEAQRLMASGAAAGHLQGAQPVAPSPAAPVAVPSGNVSPHTQGGSTTIVILADGQPAAPETAASFTPDQLTAEIGVRGVNNYVCQGWQLKLEEYGKIEHPTAEEHEELIKTAKECLLVMDNAAMVDPGQYVYNAIIYRNCNEIVRSACDAEYHTQKEDGSWKKERLSFASKLLLPGQKDSWEDKFKAQRKRIVEEFEKANPDNVSQRANLKAQEDKVSADLGELKDEKKSKGFFNFSEKKEVKERMSPVKEELSQIRSAIRALERAIDDYVDERLDEHAGSYVMLDF